MYYWKAIGLRVDELLCIQLDVKLKLKLKINKIRKTIYIGIYYFSGTFVILI
jgi:hypothetical protein